MSTTKQVDKHHVHQMRYQAVSLSEWNIFVHSNTDLKNWYRQKVAEFLFIITCLKKKNPSTWEAEASESLSSKPVWPLPVWSTAQDGHKRAFLKRFLFYLLLFCMHICMWVCMHVCEFGHMHAKLHACAKSEPSQHLFPSPKGKTSKIQTQRHSIQYLTTKLKKGSCIMLNLKKAEGVKEL